MYGLNTVVSVGAFDKEYLLVSEFEGADVVFGDSTTLQANTVHGSYGSREALNYHVRRYILRNPGATADHGVFPYAHKLMESCESSDNGPIADMAVSCHAGKTGEDAVVAHHALVTAVRIDKEEIIVADDGFSLRRCGAIDVAILAEDIVVPNFQEGRFAFVLEVLRLQADH